MYVVKDQITGTIYKAEDSFDLEEMLHRLCEPMVNTPEDEDWDPKDASLLGIVKPSTVQNLIATITQNAGNPNGTYYGDAEAAIGFDVTYYEEDPEPEVKCAGLAELRDSCRDAADALADFRSGDDVREPAR